MIALIDGDIVVYRVGFASQNQTEAQNCINAELVIEDILKATEADSFKIYLSDSLVNNFRYKIDNNYKANRAEADRPKYYDSVRQFLINEFKAEITEGQEADDALGIEQCKGGGNTVICSIDKDLLQIPGKHYNIVSKNSTTVIFEEGIRHFYKQLLIGDRVDNIRGVDGIGKVKSAQLLDSISSERDMFERVRGLYQDDERLLRNGQLLWVRRKENELWGFPENESGVEGDYLHEVGGRGEADSRSLSNGDGMDSEQLDGEWQVSPE